MTSDIRERLEAEIAETDEFIAGLGPEGADYVQRLHAVGMKHEVYAGGGLYQAAYDWSTRTYHCPVGGTLAQRFNWRVHEGAHALQGLANQEVVARHGGNGPEAPVTLDLESVIKCRRAGEVNAYSIQARFNALAVRKTGNDAFVTAMTDGPDSILTYGEALGELVGSGRSPEEVGQAMAARFLSLNRDIQIRTLLMSLTINVNNRDLFDGIMLNNAEMLLDQGRYAREGLATVTPEQLGGLLNTYMTLDPDRRIENTLAGPLELSEENRRIFQCLNAQLQPG